MPFSKDKPKYIMKSHNFIFTIHCIKVISAEQLLENLADMLINLQPDSLNAEQDFHHNMNDAIAILPKLQSGLDVNIR